MWFVVIPLLIGITILAVWVGRGRGPTPAQLQGELARALKVHGPMRCLIAIDVLTGLARRGDEGIIQTSWSELELPLLEVLSDCPPDRKGDLAEALTACHARCRNRELQKSLMTMRNAVLG